MQPASGTPQRQTTITVTTTETITTTTTTQTQIISPSPEPVPTNASNVPPPENSKSRRQSHSTTRSSISSISSHASHPDDLRQSLPNQTVDGFYVVRIGKKPGIFFSRQDASASGPTYRKYKTWQAAYKAYTHAYFADKVRVTADNNYQSQPSQTAGEREAMFWERVDKMTIASSDEEDGCSSE